MMNPLAAEEAHAEVAAAINNEFAAEDNNGTVNINELWTGQAVLNHEYGAIKVVIESMHIFKHHLGLFLCCSLVVLLCRQALFAGSVILITAIATRDTSITSILSRFSSDETIILMVNSVSTNVSISSYPSSREAAEEHGELYMQLFLLSLSSCTAICSVAIFLGTYTMVLPTAFVAVSQYYVLHLGGRFQRITMMETAYRGCKVGKGRVAKLILWWVLARELMIVLLFCYLHGDTFQKDKLRTIRLLIEAMLTPFTFTAPIPMVITNKYECELAHIWAYWEIPAAVLASFFVLVPYIVIMNQRRINNNNNWWLADGVRGGHHLSSLVHYANLKIKFVETMVCGPPGWIVCHSYGSDFTLVFQAVAEIFFVVTYVVFYFLAMFEGGEGLQGGERFQVGDIQEFLDRL